MLPTTHGRKLVSMMYDKQTTLILPLDFGSIDAVTEKKLIKTIYIPYLF